MANKLKKIKKIIEFMCMIDKLKVLTIIVLFSQFIPKNNFGQDFYNMTKVADNMWVDNTEITVNQYRQFLLSLPIDERTKYLPDSALILQFDTVTFQYYFNHPAFDDYPMICINYDQVIDFCEWRTQLYNNEPNNKIKVTYTLPTMEEWSNIAKIGKLGGAYAGTLNHPITPVHRKEKKYYKKNKFLIVCKETDFKFTSNSIKCFGENKIKGLAGNVAEMTLDKKIVGGSWYHPAEKSLIGATIDENPNVANVWMGFRCIVTVD
jgi:formylglycine-generating enzyme required for sulfatase activity